MRALFSEKRKVFQSPACWWLSLAALYLYVAVYRWDYLELRYARNSLMFVLIALVTCAVGIFQSSRDRDHLDAKTPSGKRRLLAAVLLLTIGIHTGIAIWIVRHQSGTDTDVFTIETSAVEALLHGVNPYTITQQNIYNAHQVALFYPPGTLVGGRLQFGFPYPPLPLLCAAPGYLLGDVRYAHIAAMVISALLMAWIRMSKLSVTIACLFLLNPLTFLMERYSWTDSFVVLPLCATVYAAVKRRWWLPIALGLFLVSKQYAVLALPFVLLLGEFDWKRSLKLAAQALSVGAILTVPFALWNVRHFFQDTIIFILKSPARTDSLSFAARLHIPFYLAMAAVVVATVWTLRVTKRHPAMFAACFGFVLLIFVCMGRQAFSNYYFLVTQSLWLAVIGLQVPGFSPGGALDNSPARVHSSSLASWSGRKCWVESRKRSESGRDDRGFSNTLECRPQAHQL